MAHASWKTVAKNLVETERAPVSETQPRKLHKRSPEPKPVPLYLCLNRHCGAAFHAPARVPETEVRCRGCSGVGNSRAVARETLVDPVALFTRYGEFDEPGERRGSAGSSATTLFSPPGQVLAREGARERWFRISQTCGDPTLARIGAKILAGSVVLQIREPTVVNRERVRAAVRARA